MAKRKRRPSLFKNQREIKSRMESLGDKISDKTLDAGLSAIKKAQPGDLEVKKMPKYLEVTNKRMEKMGVIDLKPYFAKSNKRKKTKDGGWYLRVPIRRKVSSMSRRMYDDVRSIDIQPEDRRTVVSNYLYDRRRESSASMLNYQPQSFNIEKRRTGNNRHAYTAFRTVSNKSHPSSFIINRDRVNTPDTSKTFVRNVNRLMKWKLKNGWS